ncbi:MAG TPA: TFIIB-type zinc ribbon-containing protein [Candidatus Nitrosotenuis sp.]
MDCKEHLLVNDHESGELVCGRCGLVIQEKIIEERPEWRTLENSSERSRVGDGTYLSKHDRGLATIIGPANKDVTGKPLSVSMKNTISRLRIWDSRSQAYNSSARNLRRAFSELLSMREKLGLSDVIVEKTAYLYRKAHEKKLTRGRPISAFICAALYAACRDSETPRTVKDIAKASGIKSKQINKCYRRIIEGLDLRMPTVNPIQCVSKIANKVGVSEKTKRVAVSILQNYEKSGNSAGKSPMCIAATAVYLAAIQNDENYTQKAIANAANVTEVAIRNRVAEIRMLN